MTRLLLRATAITLGCLGVVTTFAPDSVLLWLSAPDGGAARLLAQLVGALAIGFAMLDWMLRDTPIGGIYGRPIALANLVHLVSAAIATGKLVASEPTLAVVWLLCAVQTVLALGFIVVIFRPPTREKV